MTGGLALIATLLGSAPTAGLVPADAVEVAAREVRIADVARIGGLDRASRARLGRTVIAVLPDGRSEVTLSRKALAALVRRGVPGLDVAAGGEGAIRIRAIGLPAAPPKAAGECKELAAPVARGALLAAADARSVPCDGNAPQHAVQYDRRHGVVRAAADLPAGAYLGRVALPAEAGIERGAALTLVSTVGPVRIEREVVAVQPARPGGKIFVRDEEGGTFAAPLATQQDKERRR
jgi:hypothetical protein